MADFDAVFFDMDGTLVENSKLMPAAFQQAFAAAGYEIDIQNWRGSGCTDYEVMDKYLADYPLREEEKEELIELPIFKGAMYAADHFAFQRG